MVHEWSAQQLAIISWFESGSNHKVVRARAGTGKSTIIEAGVKVSPSKSILVAAFSKIIQLSFEERFMVNDGVRKFRTHPHIQVKTLHALGLQLVRRARRGILVDFTFTRAETITEAVCGPRVPTEIKKLVTKLHTKGREIAPHAKEAGELIDIAIQFECEPDEAWANSGFPLEKVEELALAAMEWAGDIKDGTTIDGADMIFLPLRNPWLIKMFDEVVIDEAQDMTPAQLEIGLGVLKPGGRMCIVGDNKQAIFGFRGADSNSLDRLKAELDADELGLTTTYRCGKVIVAEAQTLVPDIEADENNPEGEILNWSARQMIEDAGPGDYILSRVNAPLVSIAMKLLRQGKRTRIAGRDIGKGLIALVRKMRGRSVPDFLQKVAAWEEKEINRLRKMLVKAEEHRKRTIEGKIEDVSDQAEMLMSLTEGVKSVDAIEDRIVALFTDDGLGEAGMITCSSVHRAKGLEANRVFVLRDTLRDYNDEERNIAYVAITRAKKTLVYVTTKTEEAL